MNKIDLTIPAAGAYLVGSLFVAVPGVLGVFWNPQDGTFTINKVMLILAVVCALAICFCFLSVLGMLSNRDMGKVSPCGRDQLTNPIKLMRNQEFARTTLLISALYFFSWIPYLLIMYPGPFCWDTYYQVAQCFPERYPMIVVTRGIPLDSHFIDHSPLFDSLLYGLFIVPSVKLTGSWNAGIFAYGVLSDALFAISVSFLIQFTSLFGASKAFRLFSIGFYAVVPLFGLYSCMMLKDVTFSILFIWWFIYFIWIVQSRGAALSNKWTFCIFLLLSILAPLTKKTGLAVIAPSLLVLFLYCRGYRKQAFTALLSSVMTVLVVFPLIVFPLLDVAPGGKQEALSVMFQQTACFAKHHPDELTDSDKESIDRILIYDSLADRYDPINSNPVKGQFDYWADADGLLRYAAVWLKQGLSDPVLYLKSTWSTCYGFFSPTGFFDQYILPMARASYVHEGDVVNPDKLSNLRGDLLKGYDAFCRSSGVGLLVSIVLYAWWIPVLAFTLRVAAREWKALLCIAPLLLSAATCILSFEPFIGRYVLHLAYVAPLAICIGFNGLSLSNLTTCDANHALSLQSKDENE